MDDLDSSVEGVLVASDNFHALSLASAKYRKSIRLVHIDPPYNTETSGFLYKNGYQHSSWMTMMADRLAQASPLMASEAALAVHIDENERVRSA
jgi:adenine-specific DNA-methyltransferase